MDSWITLFVGRGKAKEQLCTTPVVDRPYTMRQSTHGVTGISGGMKKWRCFNMRNPKPVPYETIVRATSGELEAIDEVFRHYSKRIRLASLENGQVNKDTEDNIKRRLIAALFQFRFDGQPT